MRWDERQRAMLAEMGLRLWPERLDASARDTGAGRGEEAATGVAAPAGAAAAGAAAVVARNRHEAASGTGNWHGTAPGADGRRETVPGHVVMAPLRRDGAGAGPPRTDRTNPVVRATSDLGEPRGVARAGASGASHVAGPGTVAPADRPAGPEAGAVLARLAADAAVCTACALCAGRTHSVFDNGPAPADWMIVGDAPDADDDAAGAPFAGAAGQLLDNMLHAVDVTRAASARVRHAYVTQAVKCRPPAQRVPEPAELATCARFLQGQIGQVQPRIILAMGRSAAQALLRTDQPVSRLRGQVHRHDGIAVVVTAAPAYLLRHPDVKAAAWTDLCLALEMLRG